MGELAAPFDISLPAVSRHLKVLEARGPDLAGPRGRSGGRARLEAGAAAGNSMAGSTATGASGRGSFDRMDAYLAEIAKETAQHDRAGREPVADDELYHRATFDAPVALVFRIWEDASTCVRWWGPKDFACTALDMRLPRRRSLARLLVVGAATATSWMGGRLPRDRARCGASS